MELQKVIAANVKRAREAKKLTLDAAAKQTGVSRSMLAQLERGDVNPTISVLWKIANGYKVSFTSLMDSGAEGPLVIRAADVTPLAEDGQKFLNFPAFPFQADKLFETYRIQIEPGGSLDAQPHMAGTEEYITVFSGNVAISVGQEIYRLSPGDSLRFQADTEHSYRNTGEDTAQLSMIICYSNGL